MSALTWEQKLAALNALSECSLKMRKPGDWYVSQSVEVKQTEGDGVLVGSYGGTTPQEAVEEHWNALTEDGFMWVDLTTLAWGAR